MNEENSSDPKRPVEMAVDARRYRFLREKYLQGSDACGTDEIEEMSNAFDAQVDAKMREEGQP